MKRQFLKPKGINLPAKKAREPFFIKKERILAVFSSEMNLLRNLFPRKRPREYETQADKQQPKKKERNKEIFMWEKWVAARKDTNTIIKSKLIGILSPARIMEKKITHGA